MEEYEHLEIGQIELLHDQTHERLGAGEEDCDMLRMHHDSLAAELVGRGISHDTEMLCPEPETNAPNYRRGFTDDTCSTCAFGQLSPWCNLYKFDYTKGYTCDSFRYVEMMELEPPHGFLMASGKQTAVAGVKAIDTDKAYLIVSNGEAFGVAILEQPAQVKTAQFETDEWQDQHRITPRERRQWWPETDLFYVHRLKEWYPYDGVKLYENGKVIDEPKLTGRQWHLISKAKELPKTILLADDVVSVTEKQEFIISLSAKCEELENILSAAYETEVIEAERAKELIPIYSLALVRNPRMRVSKKNIIAEGETDEADKQEGDDMPYRIRKRDGEWCVIKINPDESDEEVGCHDNEDDADAQLAALRINVGVEEGAAEKPKKEFEGLDQIIQSAKQYRKPGNKTKKEYVTIGGHQYPIELDATMPHDQIVFKSGKQVVTVNNIDTKQFDESEWSGAAANWPDSAAYCSDCLIDVNPAGEDKVQALCKLPYRKPGSQNPNKAALRNIAARFNQLEKPGDVPADKWNSQTRAAANKLIGWWPEAFDQPAPEPIYQAIGRQRPEKSKTFVEKLKLAAKSILDIITLAETDQEETKETELFMNEVGIAQKRVNGKLWHFTYSTNAFIDREGEIFSTKALEDYVTRNEANEEKGFFNLWHINKEDGNFNTDFARKEWQGVIGRFLVEAGPYLDNERGKAAKEFFKQYGDRHPDLAPEGWGCSPEFRYLPEERATGTYDNIWITRTSTLPKYAAANIWTETRQLKAGDKMTSDKKALSEQQMKMAIEMFGDDFVRNMITEGEAKTADLEKAGIDYKSQPPEPQEVQLDIEALAQEVSKQFTMDLTPIAEAMATMASSQKEIMARLEKLEGEQAIKEKTETPRFIFNVKRASEDEETVVAEGDDLKDRKPHEAKGRSGDPWAQIFR